MPTKKTASELKAELADARREIRTLEAENDDLQERLDEIAGIVGVEEDEDGIDDADEDEGEESDAGYDYR